LNLEYAIISEKKKKPQKNKRVKNCNASNIWDVLDEHAFLKLV